MSLIELRNISKIYKMGSVELKAVDSASFSIEKGQFAAISGPSGSGKSTLLNIIGLTDVPSAGSLILDGIDIYKNSKLSVDARIPANLDGRLTELRRKLLGFVFQTFNLVPVLNVRENIEMPLHLGSSPAVDTMSRKEQDEWIDFLLATVGLEKWANHRPSELSGGQRQRVAIARALVSKAPVILADEPTANLDSKNGDQILELMRKLNKELSTTFVFSTHDQKIVQMADHVIRVSDGRVLEK